MLKWLCLVLLAQVEARLNVSCTGYSPSLGQYDGLQCDSGQCVIQWFVCDGDTDCEDGSDETDCDIYHGLQNMLGACHAPKAGFGHGVRCPSGECVQRRLLCEGNKDCLDGSDEVCNRANSSLLAAELSGTSCESSLGPGRTCGSTRRCLPLHWFCDGENDCLGGEDEKFCGRPSCRSLLGPGIRCGIRCVPKIFFCDGDKDCVDGRDEENCPNFRTPSSYTEYEELIEETTPNLPTRATTRTTTTTTRYVPRPSKSTISHSKLDSEFSDRGHQLQSASATHDSTSNSSQTQIFSFLILLLLILQTSLLFNQ